MSAKKKTDEELLEEQKKSAAKAAEDAARIKDDGGVWKVTLEDQAKYAAEHSAKKSTGGSGKAFSGADASAAGYTAAGSAAKNAASAASSAGSYNPKLGANIINNKMRELEITYGELQKEALAAAAKDPIFGKGGRATEARKRDIAATADELQRDYAERNREQAEREVKQAREDEARNALFAEKERAERAAENVRRANSSALDKARNSSLVKNGSAAEFYKNRSETMGKAAIGDLENLERIKKRDLRAELKLEGQKIKYQWEEAGRRYDALSDEEKQALYRRTNSSALDRSRMVGENGGLRGSTAQETRNNISNSIYNRYVKMDEESRDPNNAEKYAFINRLRSAAGEGVENFGLWLYETFGYEPGKRVYDAGEARAIGEVTNEQVQKLVDAAPSQLGKDLVKVSDSVAQQLSYKILTAPLSMFGSSIVSDKVLSKTGSFAAAEKAAHDFKGGIYTGGMAMSSAADKYVQSRAEGQGKLEASVRAMGTGLISYFSESLGGIGGSKSPLNGLEEKYAESLIGSILYNAFEEGGEEFVEYLGDYLLDGAVDLAARGEWQQEWSWEEVIENAKIGAMSGGLFGGYNKLQSAVYSRIDEANAIRLEKAAQEYSDYMKNAYRLMNDPNLREIAERQIDDTVMPAATRMTNRETGEMNFGDVLPKKAGTVSAEQMYGVKLPQESKSEDFNEWAAREDAEKVTNGQQIEENASFSRKIDNIESLSEGGYIPVGRVLKGSALNDIGLASTNIYFDKSKIVKSLDEHSDHITKEILKQIPQILNEPIVITEANAENTANVFGNVYIGSSPLMVGVMVTKSRDGKTEINKVRTVHARRDAGKKITDSSVLYLNPNKEKTQTWFQALGNDVPLGGTKFGFIRRIADKLKKVNGENQGLNEINLMETSTGETRPRRVAEDAASGLQRTNSAPSVEVDPVSTAQGTELSSQGDVPSPNANIPQNGNGVNTSDVKNSAAQAGAGETDKADKFIEDTQKRIEDAKITDDKLKNLPEDKQKDVLKDRAERAGIDISTDELVDFAQSLSEIKGFYGREFKDFARIFDDVSGESVGIRNELHKFFEVPHRQAQAQYTENYKNAVKMISNKFAELGIKAGSKESAAVQRIGEHAYQIDSKGNTAEYTLDMLKHDFPESWEKIEEAAKYCEEVYYDYLKKLNAMYESIYPNTVEKAQGYKNKVLERAAASQQKADNMREVKNKYERDLAAKKELFAKKKKGTRVYAEMQNQILNLESKIRNAEAAVETYESRAFADKTKAELLQGQIDSGEILKNKQIKPRKDYFRHFQDMNNSFQEIADIFSNDQNISPELIGKSAETKPRAMWLSEAQERAKVHAYTEDAVGGMLRYAKTAETALAYDPLISKFRDLSTVIRTAATLADQKTTGTGTSAAKLAEYIDLWTNNIAGKSYGLDRWVFDAMGNKGRAVMKAVDKLNGNIKGSLVMLNFNTALKQISNVPNATAYIPNPAAWAKGAAVTAEAVFGKTDAAKALRDARNQSSFMNERYLDDTISDLTKNIEKKDILSKPKKFEGWLIGAGDRAAAELIWYTAYTHYNNDIAKAMKHMGRNYDSAIDYADDITRRSVAGRGRGETALAETSKLMGLAAPFQVETNNSYQLLKEQIGKKNAAGVIALQVNTFLLNAAYTAAFGSGVLGFDFIAATIDVIKNAIGADEDDDEEKGKKKSAKDTANKVFDVMEYAAGRYGGELLSGMPMGAQIAEVITAGDSDFADKLFGDNNPAKYGNGIALISSGVNTAKAVSKARKGQADLLDIFDAASPLIGRRQLGRTAKGVRSMIEGGVYGYDSEGKRYLKYAQGNGVADWAKAILLGQYATDAGREYVDGGFKSLSAKDTKLMEIADGMGVPKKLFYDTVMGMKKAGSRNEQKQEWLYNNENLTADQKRIIDSMFFGDQKADGAILSSGARRDYSSEDAFINTGYSEKVQEQIREAGKAEITREQLLEVLKGTKGKNSYDSMEKIYSTKGLTPEQQDKLGDIVLGDNGKGRRESYAAANVSISDRVLVEGILSDYKEQKKLTGDEATDELNERTFIMDKLMAEGKSEFEAYRLYKIQDGSWANSTADLDDKEKKRAKAAKNQYGLSENDYVIIKNYAGLAEGEKDEYGNTVSGSVKADNIKNLAKLLHCSEEEATRRLTLVDGCKYSVDELSSSARKKLAEGKKYGWAEANWLKAANAIKLSGASKKEEKIKALRDAGFSATEAAGYYNLNEGNDYYSAKAASTPYGLSSTQYDKTKYWSEKSGKSEKEVAGYFKAIKGLKKKADIIAALEAAGMSSSEANDFYKLRQGHDSGYKAYKNGE